MSIAVKSGLPSLGSTEGAVITKDDISVTEETSPSASAGEDLPRGKSAYEIAKENGFNGTEAEWLASLKGEPGAAGASGKDGENGKTPYVGDNGNWYIGADDTGKPSRGAKGDKGEKGDTGAQGIQGEKGDTGAQGIQGEKGDTGAQGPQGAAGADGKTPNITIGNVETLEAGQNATASITGESPDLTLNLGIPKGADGQPGADGKTAYQYAQDGGYTRTETEFAAKLAQEQLTGTTDELTPTQVYQAVSAGIPVKVQYLDGNFGIFSYTNFNAAENMNAIAANTIVYYNGVYMLGELIGNTDVNEWFFLSTALAQKTDIPTALPNPNALTFTGAVNATYDGSTAVSVEIPSGGSGGTDISLGLTSASVGQIIKVKAIDESGKPTAWEAANMQSGGGGGGHWETVLDTVWEQDVINPTAYNSETGIFTCAEGELNNLALNTEYVFFQQCVKEGVAYNTIIPNGGHVKITKLSDTTFSIDVTPPTTFVPTNVKFSKGACLAITDIDAKKIRLTLDGQFGVTASKYNSIFFGAGKPYFAENVGYVAIQNAYHAYQKVTVEVESPYRIVGEILCGFNAPSNNGNLHFKNNSFCCPLIPKDMAADSNRTYFLTSDGTKIAKLYSTSSPWHLGGAHENTAINNDYLGIISGTKVKLERWVE